MSKAAQIISVHLTPLYENNDFIIKNTQGFAQLILEQHLIQENEEYVSYDVESILTDVLMHDIIIKYILEEIFPHDKLPHICSKFIFKRLLLELATESIHTFQSQFFQIN